jgi:FMN phosphatase YigB (HAD superfamily)
MEAKGGWVGRREVIFMDADETLFDFRKAEAFALERAFAQFGLELSEDSIRGYLSGVVISEAVSCSKPSPLIFDRAAELLGFHDKAGMLMVGDSLGSDIQGGINYGIDTCWVNPGSAKNETSIIPSFEIRSLGELRTIL